MVKRKPGTKKKLSPKLSLKKKIEALAVETLGRGPLDGPYTVTVTSNLDVTLEIGTQGFVEFNIGERPAFIYLRSKQIQKLVEALGGLSFNVGWGRNFQTSDPIVLYVAVHGINGAVLKKKLARARV